MSLHVLQGCLNFDFIENCTHSFFPLYSPAILLLQIEGFGNHVQSCGSYHIAERESFFVGFLTLMWSFIHWRS